MWAGLEESGRARADVGVLDLPVRLKARTLGSRGRGEGGSVFGPLLEEAAGSCPHGHTRDLGASARPAGQMQPGPSPRLGRHSPTRGCWPGHACADTVWLGLAATLSLSRSQVTSLFPQTPPCPVTPKWPRLPQAPVRLGQARV